MSEHNLITDAEFNELDAMVEQAVDRHDLQPTNTNANLWNYQGSRLVTDLNELRTIPLPEQTDSYTPVAHYDFLLTVQRLAGEILGPKGFTVTDLSIQVAKEGNRLFAILSFKNGHDGLQMAIGLRNSYDKSMKAGFCAGGKVVVCDNLVMAGDIVILHLHTGDVLSKLHDNIILSLFKVADTWTKVQEDEQIFRQVKLSHLEVKGLLWDIHQTKLLPYKQVPGAVNYVLGGTHGVECDLWGVYNACTWFMKALPPHKILQAHVGLHRWAEQVALAGEVG